MVIRITRQTIITMLLLAMLVLSMMLEMSRAIILVGVLALAFCGWLASGGFSAGRDRVNENLTIFSAVLVILVLMLLFMQYVALDLTFSDLLLAATVETAIFIAPILAFFLVRSFRAGKSYFHAFRLFVYGFAVYYMILVIINGMPDGRGSALGVVSSNFCATVLYLTFPFLLYYLMSPDIKKTKAERNSILVALLVSVLVILTTGSRTAIGALIVVAVFLFFYSARSRRTRRWFLRIILGTLIVGAILLAVLPQTRELLERAFSAFTEEGNVSSDVRSEIVWEAALEEIRNNNWMIGSATNIMTGDYKFAAHNLWLEIMMSCGLWGILLWVALAINSVLLLLRTRDRAKIYFGAMLLALYVLSAFFQPFFSTGYVCGIITWISFYAITLNKKV